MSVLLKYTQRCLLRIQLVSHDAEDILQDSFTATWVKQGELQAIDMSGFSFWMQRVIRNRIIDIARQEYARGCRPDTRSCETMECNKVLSGDGRSSESNSEGEDTDRGLARLRALPQEEHLCLMLHDLMGLEWSLVSLALGRTVQGAKALRKRARYRIG